MIGKPTKKVWPEFFELSNSKHLSSLVEDHKYNNIGDKFSKMSDNCIDLLNGLLTWDPAQRLTVNLLFYFDYTLVK